MLIYKEGFNKDSVLINNDELTSYFVGITANQDKIRNFKISAYKNGILGTLSYYRPYIGDKEPFIIFGNGEYINTHVVTEDDLSVINEDCGEPIPGISLLVPNEEPNKELIDIYLSGELDYNVQTFQCRRKGSRNSTYVYPIIVKGESLGAVEIKGRHHAMHSILKRNYCLLDHIPGCAIDYALQCFDIEVLRFPSKELLNSANTLKSKTLTRAIIRRLENENII